MAPAFAPYAFAPECFGAPQGPAPPLTKPALGLTGDYLLDYAREDWVGLSPVNAVAGAVAGKGATFEELTSAMVAVIGDLIDRGAVPGDLIEQDPGFKAWSGTKEERLRRIAAETKARLA